MSSLGQWGYDSCFVIGDNIHSVIRTSLSVIGSEIKLRQHHNDLTKVSAYSQESVLTIIVIIYDGIIHCFASDIKSSYKSAVFF